jgi:hypothetical protein
MFIRRPPREEMLAPELHVLDSFYQFISHASGATLGNELIIDVNVEQGGLVALRRTGF